METEKDDKVKFIFLVKYAHGFDVFYFNFVIFFSFTRIIKSCFTGTEGVMAQCQWSNHDVCSGADQTNIKTLHHRPLWGESTGAQWILLTKDQ